LKTLWIGGWTPNWLLSTAAPIRKLEDLKGKVVGISSPGLISDILKAWGASPEVVTSPEMYLALERKMINAMHIPVETLLTFKLNEIVKYATNIRAGGVGPNFTVMTKEKFKQLPPDIQKIIEEMRPWAESLQREKWDALTDSAIADAKGKGIQISELSDEEMTRWLELRRPAVSQFLKTLDARGVPATQLYDDVARMAGEAGYKVK